VWQPKSTRQNPRAKLHAHARAKLPVHRTSQVQGCWLPLVLGFAVRTGAPWGVPYLQGVLRVRIPRLEVSGFVAPKSQLIAQPSAAMSPVLRQRRGLSRGKKPKTYKNPWKIRGIWRTPHPPPLYTISVQDDPPEAEKPKQIKHNLFIYCPINVRAGRRQGACISAGLTKLMGVEAYTLNARCRKKLTKPTKRTLRHGCPRPNSMSPRAR
jgi:hypothetical protein